MAPAQFLASSAAVYTTLWRRVSVVVVLLVTRGEVRKGGGGVTVREYLSESFEMEDQENLTIDKPNCLVTVS